MKNAFTLIELLAIVVFLGVIVLVAVPSLINSNKVSKNNEIEDFNENISVACEAYAATNTSATSVTVRNLIDNGYLKKSLTNPETEKKVYDENGTVKITKTNGEITCTYTK